jgi:hypothetical protein
MAGGQRDHDECAYGREDKAASRLAHLRFPIAPNGASSTVDARS